MRFEEKINVMLVNGKLSGEQAEALRRSLGSSGATMKQRGAVPTLFILGAFLLLLLIAFYVGGGGQSSQAVQNVQNVAETINQSGKVGEMSGSMSKTISMMLLIVPVLLIVTYLHNSLVSQEEDVLVAWSQVEANYQRRADLIPNLVSTVKTFAEHEGNTLTNITELRAKADKISAEQGKVNVLAQGAAVKLSDDSYMENLAKAQAGVSGELKGFMLSVEAYPQLLSSDHFLELQAQLEGTENRINVARMAFNEKVGEFNSSIRRMPYSLMASAGGFQRKAYFKADEGTNKAVKVDFNHSVTEQ